MPVLGGVVAGMTVTASSVVAPGETVDGLADIDANKVAPPPLHITGVEAVFLGAEGTWFAKSSRLLSVSWQPPDLRIWLLSLPGAVVLTPSKNMLVAVPQPTASTMLLAASRIARPPAPAAIEPIPGFQVRSGTTVPSYPGALAIKKYCPG